MSLLGELIVKVSADIASFQKDMSQAAKDFKSAGQSMSDVGKQLSIDVSAGLIAISGLAVKVAGDLQKQTVQFTALLGSA